MPPLGINYRVHKPLWADIQTINLSTKLHFNICNLSRYNDRKLQIIGIFQSPWGHNSVENCSIVTKTEIDLEIRTINLYTKFHFEYSK